MTAGQTNPIIAGGSGSESTRRHQPRALLFGVLALLWVFPTVGALCILVPGFLRWIQAPGWGAALRSVAFEHWIALAVLLLHPVFVLMAMRFRKTEPYREMEPDEPEPPEGPLSAERESKN